MSQPVSERFNATYRISVEARDVQARAQALALEQSIEMPLEAVTQPFVRERVVARVESIEPVAAASGRFDVKLALAARTTGFEAGQLLNMLFGNCSLQPDVELIDFEPEAELLQALPGPRFGLDGWRRALGLDHAPPRPLTCTALKPQGLSPLQLSELARTFALAGIDVIKDDHGIADQEDARFAARVASVQRAVEQAARERGPGRVLYAPTLSGGPRRLREQLRVARDEGVGAVLICPMLCGVPTLVELVREEAGVPILAHPAFAGSSRIAPELLLGRLFRMFGADATIFPNFGGRFSYDRATCRAIARRAREPLGRVPAILPVPAGGMRTEGVDEMIDEFGADVMLLIGGHLLAGATTPGDSVLARAKAFVERVHAAAALRAPAAGRAG